MLLPQTRRRDVLKPWIAFRDAETGRYVSRWFAFLNPKTTVSERRR
jgi:hypothetical protein